MDESLPASSLSTHQLIENIHEGVLITDTKGNIKAVNTAFCKVTGYSPEDVIGQNPRILKSGKHTDHFYKKLWASLQKNGFWQGEICNKKKNGKEYIEWLTISAVKNKLGHITHYLGMFIDITKQKRAEDTIRHMAYYDPLTNLPNRALFRDRLKQNISFAHRHQKLLAVLFLDLDRVKIINDTLGHDVGDILLQSVARRLETCLREEDTIARLGGDEFMILLPDISNTDDVVKITEKVLQCLRPPFLIDGHELYITASIGISFYPQDAADVETLLKNADTAMYRAKQLGRNTFQIFNDTMKADAVAQLALDHNLRRALDKNEFVLHYQPQIDIASGRIVGMEALIRWQHPELGLLPPLQFIQWAEDTGLIVPIGEWVMRTACKKVKEWHAKGHNDLRIAINLSAHQVKQKNFIKLVSDVLHETDLSPEFLELEFTESVAIESSGPTLRVPHELRAMGVRLSIDDFGTGYSSLNYLKYLPVNTLKMDRSFINDLTLDRHDAAIATAVITLGHGLNLNVLAEGVETEDQLTFLRDRKCDGIQGFYFSKPVPDDEFGVLLDKKQLPEEANLFTTPR